VVGDSSGVNGPDPPKVADSVPSVVACITLLAVILEATPVYVSVMVAPLRASTIELPLATQESRKRVDVAQVKNPEVVKSKE